MYKVVRTMIFIVALILMSIVIISAVVGGVQSVFFGGQYDFTDTYLLYGL